MKMTQYPLLPIALVVIIAAMVIASLAHAQGPIPQPISPLSANLPLSSPGKITYKAVPIPTDVDVSVKEIWQEHLDFVALNKPEVDAVLTAHHITVIDSAGAVVFPRP